MQIVAIVGSLLVTLFSHLGLFLFLLGCIPLTGLDLIKKRPPTHRTTCGFGIPLAARDTARAFEAADKAFRYNLHASQEHSGTFEIRLAIFHATQEESLETSEDVRSEVKGKGCRARWWGRGLRPDVESKQVDYTTRCVGVEMGMRTGKRTDWARCGR